MKRKSNLYKDICNYDNIRNMYFDIVRKNTKNKRKLEKFETHLSSNLYYIYDKLNAKNYNFKEYNIFLIKDPKYRIIMSENVHDKIVNHLVSKYILGKCILDSLIDSNVATRVDKGTKYGNYLIRKYLNNIRMKHANFYILKLDIKKYFYNIDHKILIEKFKSKCKDKDAMLILKKILDTTDDNYVNQKIHSIITNELERNKNLNKIMELNSIEGYKRGKGIPIGNMSSQILAIFYLNDLDHFIKEKLNIKYYVRYMDDMILIHENKDYLNKCFEIIEEKLNNEYKLQLNNKSNIFDIKHGFNFLGFRYKLNNDRIFITLSRITKNKMWKNIKLYEKNNKDLHALFTSYGAIIKYSKCKYKLSLKKFKNY